MQCLDLEWCPPWLILILPSVPVPMGYPTWPSNVRFTSAWQSGPLAGSIKRTQAQLPSSGAMGPTEKLFTYCPSKLWKYRHCPRALCSLRWWQPGRPTRPCSSATSTRKGDFSHCFWQTSYSQSDSLGAIPTWLKDGESTPSPLPMKGKGK